MSQSMLALQARLPGYINKYGLNTKGIGQTTEAIAVIGVTIEDIKEKKKSDDKITSTEWLSIAVGNMPALIKEVGLDFSEIKEELLDQITPDEKDRMVLALQNSGVLPVANREYVSELLDILVRIKNFVLKHHFHSEQDKIDADEAMEINSDEEGPAADFDNPDNVSPGEEL